MTVQFGPATSAAWLVPVSGPPLDALDLSQKAQGLLIGRLEHCDLRLAVDSVSRHHARLTFDGKRWRVADLKSSWGTFVNGVRVAPDRDVALAEGDLLRISPWAFRFSTTSATRAGVLDAAVESVDDGIEASRTIHTLAADRLPTLDAEMYALLLECAAGIYAAPDEKALAAVVLEKASQGSGLSNVALLRPAGVAGQFEIIASRSAAGSAPIAYSRSLLNAASHGDVAELSAQKQNIDITQSIVSLGVRSALCVPLMLGQTVAAYLYLDSRGDPMSAARLPLRPHASSFCLALGRMAGLALANLKRADMERRSADIEADLAAAAAAQQWILPRENGNFGAFSYRGRSRPGEHVSGDFYDVFPLGDGKLAVAIGDVSGHGVAASVLMTASAGFLHAVLEDTQDASAAATRLNRFLCPRTAADRFLTLWIAVLDPGNRMAHYVDGGHGYAFVAGESLPFRQLDVGINIPIGIDDGYPFKPVPLPLTPHGRLLLISDGLVEQMGSPQDAAEPEQFAVKGVRRVLDNLDGQADLVGALFDAVTGHAGRMGLSDDATAVLVSW